MGHWCRPSTPSRATTALDGDPAEGAPDIKRPTTHSFRCGLSSVVSPGGTTYGRVRRGADACGLQHRQKLLLKRTRPMVGWLVGDVPLDPLQLGRADAECSVAMLPGEEPAGFAHPSAGVCLQGSHRIRQRHVRRENHEHVDVVLCAAYRERMHAVIARNARKVVPQAGLMVGRNEVRTLFGAEDDMEDRTDVAVGHMCRP